MNVKKKGRPKKVVPPEVVQEIIYRFENEQNTSGKIAYMDVYRFSRQLYEEGQIEYELGEFFWRKGDGRNAIDKANQVLQHSISADSDEQDSYIDTKDAIDKYFKGTKKDKEKLQGVLLLNEQKLKQFVRKNQQLKNELIHTKERLEKEILKNNQLEKENAAYQEALFQWMELSMSSNTPIKNLMSVGKSRSPETKKLLSDIFSFDPLQTFENMKEKEFPLISEKGKVLELNRANIASKSVLDDIDF